MSEQKKLYRATEGRMLGGVCTGLAQYLGLDVLLVRILFVVLGLVNGLGLVIYLAMWIIIPDQAGRELSSEASMRANINDISTQLSSVGRSIGEGRGNVIGGVILVALGAFFMLQQFIPSLSFNLFWPVLLILGGAYLLIRRR
jgi:phage shock protein C